MKLTIRMKLLGSFLLIIALLITVGVLAMTRMNSLQSTASDIQNNWLPSIILIQTMKDDIATVRVTALTMLVEQEQEKLRGLQKTWDEASSRLKSSLQKYTALISSPEERGIFESVNKNVEQYLVLSQQVAKAAGENNDELSRELAGQSQRLYQSGLDDLNRLIELNQNSGKIAADEAVKGNNSGQLLILIVGVLATIIGIGLALYISQGISTSVARVVSVVSKASQGNFRDSVEVRTRDEIGLLAASFNEMLSNLRALISQIISSSQNVAAASQQISATTEEIASGSSSQANSAQTINELFQELSRVIDSVARNAESAAEMSKEARVGAERGTTAVQASIQGMQQLTQQMSLLDNDSNKIGEIIEVIDDIAEQTNLLALNAAIEAARAGDQGRGFAVVADEVRKLAERSGEATKQIANIIKGMQHNIQHSVSAVSEATTLSERTGHAFQDIVTRVNDTAIQVSEIAAASEEQAAQSGEVLRSVEAIASVSQESAAAAEETASASQSLARLADGLNQSVASFKV
ncbi:methyl-accepting chemotaxis protein [Paenibacillus sp. y28]|uniref:methyl-accepting chemotaxis protein n=1 Tax=Paenibacillus sp. y28 TaxID=3129110 RepID=UPI003019F5DC